LGFLLPNSILKLTFCQHPDWWTTLSSFRRDSRRSASSSMLIPTSSDRCTQALGALVSLYPILPPPRI